MNRRDSMLSLGSSALSAAGHPSDPNAGLASLLILARQRLEHIQADFEDSRLSSAFSMDCVPNMGMEVEMGRYEAVIMMGMTNEELGKISTGICDTAYTALASDAILQNKRIYIPIENIELYQYSDSAPTAYYEYLHSRISMLSDSGIAICTMENIENCILDEHADAEKRIPSAPVNQPAPVKNPNSVCISKRVITERDIREVCRKGIGTVQIPVRCILTDLARELAASYGLTMVRI